MTECFCYLCWIEKELQKSYMHGPVLLFYLNDAQNLIGQIVATEIVETFVLLDISKLIDFKF